MILFTGTSFLLCIPYAIYYHEPLLPFYLPALIALISGFLFYTVSDKKYETIKNNRERVVLIISLWLVLIMAGTMPYFISKTIPSTVDVFFETISGMTATGSSILTNPEGFPKSILFWRSLTHWIGGLATIGILFIIMPSLNVGGYELFSVKENPARSFRFVAVRVFMIYCVLTLAQVLLLFTGGMNLFESLCHSFGTVSTGCFSPKNDSIAGYSFYLQYIMAFFMFLSGVSYVIYYLVITGKWKEAARVEESRIYLIVLVSVLALVAGMLYFKVEKEFTAAFRESVFQVTSFVSSSGYSVTNYLKWPSHILPLLYLLLFIGGCSGSASGGIKMSRFLVLLKNLRLQFKIPDLSLNQPPVKYNRINIDENNNLSILTFITVFGILFVVGTIFLSLCGTDLERSVFLAVSALSTYGYNMGLSDFPNSGKMVLSFLMIAGRLEIYPLLLLFLPWLYKSAGNNPEDASER
ncbi:MAG: hypothetical protein A2W90_15515 [Bacteroidetes bacterium GWF2_42_66]|nr:MAG: hypothetical protein A2W92_08045 [Bacteroidetes bacterium GWA2_42_15]OFY02670.1 MAG: hypothetical protein A2W89_04100 [Bacteroidetes bacterium GWE2_42_39]OFY43869.1 MAG: hypothetical protein A2W90_15515 [Bacteroidetes bacterium GWF2_42_66]